MAQNPAKKRPAKAATPPVTTPEPEPTKDDEAALPTEQSTVLIERRATVAEITIDDADAANAITLAFATAAEVIADAHRKGESAVELEFVIGDFLFTAAMEENE